MDETPSWASRGLRATPPGTGWRIGFGRRWIALMGCRASVAGFYAATRELPVTIGRGGGHPDRHGRARLRPAEAARDRAAAVAKGRRTTSPKAVSPMPGSRSELGFDRQPADQ